MREPPLTQKGLRLVLRRQVLRGDVIRLEAMSRSLRIDISRYGALPDGLVAVVAADGGEDFRLLLRGQLVDRVLDAAGHGFAAEADEPRLDALGEAGAAEGVDVAGPGERHDLLGQRKARAHLLQLLEALLDRAGLGHDGDQRAVLVVRAGVDQQALVDDGEADDQHVGAVDNAPDFVHVDAVVVHGVIV